MTQGVAVKIDAVSKMYGGTPVVRDLSLEIKTGEIVGLLGPNGAGKSTTINMIAGVAVIDAGSIAVFGYDTRAAYRDARRRIGVMHQEPVIEQYFSVGYALRLHAGFYGVRDDPAWRQTLIKRLGLSPHLQKRFLKLSGGMKRRFMLAKALLHRPPLLILDEPTAGVDIELRRGLWEFVREINAQGTTVLLTTHYLEEAEKMCDRIAIMDAGQLIALEKTTELLSKLGDQTLRIGFDKPLSEIGNLFATFDLDLQDSSNSIQFTVRCEDDVREIMRTIQNHQLTIREFKESRPGLEEVFMKLTGKVVRDLMGSS